jgi:alkyl-hydroperoxide reductase/thiol specific antioxidant family protein
VAGLDRARPDIEARGARLIVLGSGSPEHLRAFRDATGYRGPLLTDPTLQSFQAAGLASGWRRTFDPRSFVKGIRAFASGFRQGARRGNPVQQGGTFVLGPGPRAGFEWRDRFAGDHPKLDDVLAALDIRTRR